MPIHHTVDATQQHVHTTVSGTITTADIVRHLDDAEREGTLDYSELIDVNGVTPPFLSAEEIRQTARRVVSAMKSRRCGPRAVVVNSIVIFGLTRMFAILVSEVFPINVFRDTAQAEAWLAECSPAS
jgi:hypothetical protein